MREFLHNHYNTMSFEYTTFSVSICACACDPVCMRFRSGEINDVSGYRCKCRFVFAPLRAVVVLV